MPNGLTNDDFRKIVATPRRADFEETPRRMTATAMGFAKPTATKTVRSWPVKASQPESLLPPGYRDRAQERRERVQAGVEEVPIENEPITAEDIEALPDHLSKYLGGDENRTHLVKGLDYLLLEQSRQYLQKDEERRLEKAMVEAAAGNHAQSVTELAESPDSLSFKTTLARNIYNRCIEQMGDCAHRGHVTTAFQPGKTVYEFESDPFGSATIPTIQHRSDDDCGAFIRQIPTNLPAETRVRLNDAMNCVRSGMKPRTIQEPIIAAPPAALPAHLPMAVPRDDDDDIFADVGDYVCEPRQPDALPLVADRVVFEAEPDALYEPNVSMREAIQQARTTAGQLGVYEKNIELDQSEAACQAEPLDHVTEDGKNTILKLAMMDDYDEYTAGAQFGGYGSDDDMLRRSKKTEQRSATKISRAKGRNKQKLNSQWQQISNMIENQKDSKRHGESDGDASLAKKPKHRP